MDIDEYLWRNKITRTDFAKKAQIHRGQLSSYIHKKRTPTIEIASRIVHASGYQIKYVDLMNDTEKAQYTLFLSQFRA